MITNECRYCRSRSHGRLAGIQHAYGCPVSGRRMLRMTVEEIELYSHPDLVEIDLGMAAWYPATV